MGNETDAAEDPASHVTIDVNDKAAVARWSKALGTTDEALCSAVAVVGRRIDHVKDYLGAGDAADEQSDG